MFVGLPVVGAALGVDISRERHGDAFLHERRSPFALCGRDQIDRAELIIFPPAAPIRQLRFPFLVLGLGHGWASASGLGPRPRPRAGAADCPCD